MRILLVEDEFLIRTMLAKELTIRGHQVVAAAGCIAEALPAATELDIDLGVLDVNVAGEMSFPVAQVLAARDIPFIFATGYGSPGLTEEWRSHPVLQKPFTPEELELAITRAGSARPQSAVT